MTTTMWFYILCVLVSLYQSCHICKGRISISHSAGVHNTHITTQSQEEEEQEEQVVVVGVRLLMDQHMYSWMTKQRRDERKRIHEARQRHANTAFSVMQVLAVTVSRTDLMAISKLRLLLTTLHTKIKSAIKTLL